MGSYRKIMTGLANTSLSMRIIKLPAAQISVISMLKLQESFGGEQQLLPDALELQVWQQQTHLVCSICLHLYNMALQRHIYSNGWGCAEKWLVLWILMYWIVFLLIKKEIWCEHDLKMAAETTEGFINVVTVSLFY